MSDEEQKDNPKLVFKDLGLGASVEVTLESSKANTTGTSEFTVKGKKKISNWQLWGGTVENVTVHEGRKADEKLVMNYTGDVIFFPSEKLIPQLEQLAGGNDGVKVKVTKFEKPSPRGGVYTVYQAEKIGDGKPSTDSLTPTEQALIDESLRVVKDGYEITKSIFIISSQEPQYKGVISKDRAEELFTIFKQM